MQKEQTLATEIDGPLRNTVTMDLSTVCGFEDRLSARLRAVGICPTDCRLFSILKDVPFERFHAYVHTCFKVHVRSGALVYGPNLLPMS